MTAICKNKIPLSSESEMILKELESLHLSSFSVNLTDIFKVTSKYRRKKSPNIVKNCYLSPSGDPKSYS